MLKTATEADDRARQRALEIRMFLFQYLEIVKKNRDTATRTVSAVRRPILSIPQYLDEVHYDYLASRYRNTAISSGDPRNASLTRTGPTAISRKSRWTESTAQTARSSRSPPTRLRPCGHRSRGRGPRRAAGPPAGTAGARPRGSQPPAHRPTSPPPRAPAPGR